MRRGLAALLLMAAAACGGTAGTAKRSAELACSDCTLMAGGDVSLDFGGVVVGDTVDLPLTLRNSGSADALVAPPSLQAPFGCKECGQLSLPVAGKTTLTFVYAPLAAGDDTQVISLTPSSGKPLKVHLHGAGIENPVTCKPGSIDFAAVLVGSRADTTVTCTSTATVPVGITVLPLSTGDTTEFALPGGEPHVTLDAGGSTRVVVSFEPSAEGLYASTLQIGSEGSLGLATIPLVGRGATKLLDIEPADDVCHDLGFVHSGSSRTQAVTLRNVSRDPLHVDGVNMVGDDPFSVAPAGPWDLAPAGQDGDNVIVTVTFAPSMDGTAQSMLHVRSADPGGAARDVCFTGQGGGPTISCQPDSIPFGPTALDTPRTRRFTCTNIGVDVPGTRADDLTVQGITSSDPTFRASVEGSSSSWQSGESFQLAVTFSPTSEASFSGTITMQTNDSTHPSVALPVSGDGRDLPPCQYLLVPQGALHFGVVAPGASLTLPLRFANRGNSACIVADARITPGSDPGFQVGNTPAAVAAVVAAGATLDLPIVFAPMSNGDETGSLQLSVNGSPLDQVQLDGRGKKSCLTLEPMPLEFGLVPPGCASGERYFQIRNDCENVVNVESLAVDDVNAQVFLTGADAPAMPLLIGPGFRKELGLVYRPPGPGDTEDIGALYLDTDLEDQPFIEPLHGKGVPGAHQTETLTQSGRQQVDVLMVLGAGTAFPGTDEEAAFLDYAQQRNIDYHLGIIGTDVNGDSCPDGRLWPLGAAARFMSPANVSKLWSSFVVAPPSCSGGQGQGLEAALRALTPPVVNHDDDPRHTAAADGNQGFLRPDAHLSLLFVPAADDSSAQSVDSYVTALQSVKGVRQNNLFSVAGLIPPPGSECEGTLGSMPRYDAFLKNTLGDAIQPTGCESSTSAMSLLGTSAFGFQQCFELTNLPLGTGNNIVVSIDGKAFPSTGSHGERHWVYRSDDDALCFNPLFIPEPGSVITFDYAVACAP